MYPWGSLSLVVYDPCALAARGARAGSMPGRPSPSKRDGVATGDGGSQEEEEAPAMTEEQANRAKVG